jgi:hypothetical protein
MPVLPMNKDVGGAGLQMKSASQLPLRGNSGSASQRRFIPAVTRVQKIMMASYF